MKLKIKSFKKELNKHKLSFKIILIQINQLKYFLNKLIIINKNLSNNNNKMKKKIFKNNNKKRIKIIIK